MGSQPSYMLKYGRWTPWEKFSWPYNIFMQYEQELKRMIISFTSASKYTYSHLKGDGAVWEDPAYKHLYTHKNRTLTIEEWSDTFNGFSNWTRLNCLMGLCAYFETYIAAIVRQCVESDPGILIKSPNSVDGVKLIKQGVSLDAEMMKTLETNCTKGDWQSRINALQKLFPYFPSEFLDNISDLEKIRIMRNKVGHAFGRDIDESRNYAVTQIQPMEKLTVQRFMKWQYLIRDLACKLDIMAMKQHIGNFQPLLHCHEQQNVLLQLPNKQARMKSLKSSLSTQTRFTLPEDFCYWVLTYYENI